MSRQFQAARGYFAVTPIGIRAMRVGQREDHEFADGFQQKRSARWARVSCIEIWFLCTQGAFHISIHRQNR
jgi:hypothetical protein